MKPLASALLLLLLGLTPSVADDRRGGEFGVLFGGVAADEQLAGDSGSVAPVAGLRGGAVFSARWGWYVDGLFTVVGNDSALGDAETYIGRTGADYMFRPESLRRWFVSGGLGWMAVDFKEASAQDFHNPIASLGFGQRMQIGVDTRLRWELRGDYTLDDARLGDESVAQAFALVGLSWGPFGSPEDRARRSSKRHLGKEDDDGDGVMNKDDRCPQTPPEAHVDNSGCPKDSDGDGVPDGIDRCPRSRANEKIGPDGCPADQDGDRVPDFTDSCPDTPTEAHVDEWGCPRDVDHDGVFDGLDLCDDSPFGAKVDIDGCHRDSDGDGVVDGIDRCPNTPPALDVNERGCSVDDDLDGVWNENDRCPNSPRGSLVDSRGCPQAAPLFEENNDTLRLEGVQFESGSSELTSASTQILEDVARSLVAYPEVRIEIAGHTDSSGDDALNLHLSGARAQAVLDFLRSRGVDAGRMSARGYGETRPLRSNETPAGRAHNRRVELIRLEE